MNIITWISNRRRQMPSSLSTDPFDLDRAATTIDVELERLKIAHGFVSREQFVAPDDAKVIVWKPLGGEQSELWIAYLSGETHLTVGFGEKTFYEISERDYPDKLLRITRAVIEGKLIQYSDIGRLHVTVTSLDLDGEILVLKSTQGTGEVFFRQYGRWN